MAHVSSDDAMPDLPKREDMEFVSEAIVPERGSFSPEMMARGLASLPGAFTWRDTRYAIVACLRHEKITSAEASSAVGDVYFRRQEFLVKLDTGQHAIIYMVRSPTSASAAKPGSPRWFLYGIEPAG